MSNEIRDALQGLPDSVVLTREPGGSVPKSTFIETLLALHELLDKGSDPYTDAFCEFVLACRRPRNFPLSPEGAALVTECGMGIGVDRKWHLLLPDAPRKVVLAATRDGEEPGTFHLLPIKEFVDIGK